MICFAHSEQLIVATWKSRDGPLATLCRAGVELVTAAAAATCVRSPPAEQTEALSDDAAAVRGRYLSWRRRPCSRARPRTRCQLIYSFFLHRAPVCHSSFRHTQIVKRVPIGFTRKWALVKVCLA